MNLFAFIFLLINVVALLALPRRWAPLALIMGACYMTAAQSIDIGPFHFTLLRLLLLTGAIRAVIRRERIAGGIIGLDWIVLVWGICLIWSSAFHRPFMEALVFRLGAVYNVLGFYFLIRIFCQDMDDIVQLIKIIAFLLAPVALEMANEKLTGRNLFATFGGVPEEVMLRDGKLRAQGPFGHPILAGTVGAMCVPLMIGIWRQHARVAKIGMVACLGMVLASKSSGPLMSLALGLFGMILWRWRHLTRQMQILAVFGYFLVELISSRPAYYAILNNIDLTGSSTGWHRAELIAQAINHLGEWWFAGTDYTRHWMPYGVSSSPDHCDITNQYLFYGTWGGLPLMMIFIGALWMGFHYIGRIRQLRARARLEEQFTVWSLGIGLFAWAVTCISVSFFEQSVMFLYLNLAVVGSMYANAKVADDNEVLSERDAVTEYESEASIQSERASWINESGSI